MEYDLTIRYKNGKLQVNADTLSRYPVDEPEGVEEDEGKFLSLSLLTKENEGPLTDTATDAGRIRLRTAQRETAQWRGAMDQLEAGGSCGPFRLQGGILYMQTPRGKEAFNRLCTPEYLRKEILRTCHNEAHSAHLGVFKTTERIVRRFVWKGMYQEIRRYVLSCAECQSRKGVTTAKAGMLQCVKVERPFEKLAIDHLGPFPLSNRGNKHIIVAIDYLTKWVEARAVPSQKAEDVVKFYIEQVYCRHGSVETLASDQGKGSFRSSCNWC